MKNAASRALKIISLIFASASLVACIMLIAKNGFEENPKSYLGALFMAIGFGSYALMKDDNDGNPTGTNR